MEESSDSQIFNHGLSLFQSTILRSGDFRPLVPLSECQDEVLNPIIEDILYERTYVLLYGPKDSHKSWLAAYMAVCIATGRPFLGKNVLQGKVVYVYGEGSMIKRLRRLCKGLGCDPSDRLLPYELKANLKNLDDLQDFKDHLPVDTTVIFIDNLEKFWPSDTEEDSVNAAMTLIREIRPLATVVLVQHTRKGGVGQGGKFDGARGSSKIVNNADSTIEIHKKKGIAKCDIYQREAEKPLPISFQLVDNPDGSISLRDCGAAEPEDNGGNLINAVMQELRNTLTTAMTKTDIYETLLKGKKLVRSEAFFDTVFPQLKETCFLVETPDRRNHYILNQTSQLPGT